MVHDHYPPASFCDCDNWRHRNWSLLIAFIGGLIIGLLTTHAYAEDADAIKPCLTIDSVLASKDLHPLRKQALNKEDGEKLRNSMAAVNHPMPDEAVSLEVVVIDTRPDITFVLGLDDKGCFIGGIGAPTVFVDGVLGVAN